MTNSEGGAGVTGERRENWHCPTCGMLHGYTFRAGNITRLQLTLWPVQMTGDGEYVCPACGAVVKWIAGQAALSRLLANRSGARQVET